MRFVPLSLIVLLPVLAGAAERTRAIPLTQVPGLRIWNQGWVGSKRVGGDVVFRQQIHFKNPTRTEIAAVSVRIKNHSPNGNWYGPPIRLTNFSNADVPFDGGLLPGQKSLEMRFDAAMPTNLWRQGTWHEIELVGAEEFVNPDLRNVGHLFSRLTTGTSASAIALFQKRPELLKVRSKNGLTASMAAFAATDGPTMKWILAHGGSAKGKTDKGSTAMHLAAVNPSGGVLELAMAAGGGVNVRTANGRTPLMKAIHSANQLGWRWLLKKGANPNVMDRYGATPAGYAISEGLPNAMEDLVKAGVNPKKTDAKGFGWMHYGLSNYLMLDRIKRFGVPVDQRGPGGITPLMMSAQGGLELHTASWLLVNGANPGLKDAGGHDAYWYAGRNSPELAQSLREMVKRYRKGSRPYVGR